MSAIFEMSAPKHVRFLDEFTYYYTGSSSKRDLTYPEYASVSGRSLPIYLPIKDLDDQPTRGNVRIELMYRERAKKQVD